MFVTLKIHSAVYRCKLQGFPTALQCSICRSIVVCVLAGMNCGVRQRKLHDCQLLIGHCLKDRTSTDVCLKESLEWYMKLTLTIKSCCTVSLIIPHLLTVKREVLPCSRWVNILTLTWKTQLASVLSISSNIQNLAQQQSQGKLQWSMLRTRSFHHLLWADTAINKATYPMTSSSKWRHERLGGKKNPSPWGIG